MRVSATRTSDNRDVNACIDRLLRSDDLRRRGGSASMTKKNYNGIELGIYPPKLSAPAERLDLLLQRALLVRFPVGDRKSTRLNSSHTVISYAVFCLKKKKKCI